MSEGNRRGVVSEVVGIAEGDAVEGDVELTVGEAAQLQRGGFAIAQAVRRIDHRGGHAGERGGEVAARRQCVLDRFWLTTEIGSAADSGAWLGATLGAVPLGALSPIAASAVTGAVPVAVTLPRLRVWA